MGLYIYFRMVPIIYSVYEYVTIFSLIVYHIEMQHNSYGIRIERIEIK